MAARKGTIKLTNATKIYRRYEKPYHKLVEILTANNIVLSKDTRALDDISLAIKQGDRVGIIGENGSGKSTLLKLITGVLCPTSGSVEVNGRVSALLELGAGFNPELSGRENIQQFCMIHGFSRDRVKDSIDEIINFSEVGHFIESPVKTYSSGMAVRLGFACAVYVKPDILIVDEALSVGDAYFQNKCLHKIKSLLNQGVTFLYVSHVPDAVRSLCEQSIWIESGRIRMAGPASEVTAAYQKEIYNKMMLSEQTQPIRVEDQQYCTAISKPTDHVERNRLFAERVSPLRTGSGEIRIIDITLINSRDEQTDVFEFNERVLVSIAFRKIRSVDQRCVLAIGITDEFGKLIYHLNSGTRHVWPSDLALGESGRINFTFQPRLCPGEYGVLAGIGIMQNHPTLNDKTVPINIIDSCVGGSRFLVSSPVANTGLLDLWGLVQVDFSVDINRYNAEI